jgi:hypothetical protein
VKLILHIIIIVLCCSFPSFADEADNLEQLEKVHWSLLDSLLSCHPALDTSVVMRPVGASQPVNLLIEQEINKALRKHGVLNVLDSAAAQTTAGARMEYQSLVCDILYKKIDKLFSQRNVCVQLYLKYVASNGSVLFDDFYRRAETDTVRRKEIDHLENINLPFTHGERSASLVSRLAEPLAASLLTGMIILLFYFYRSH